MKILDDVVGLNASGHRCRERPAHRPRLNEGRYSRIYNQRDQSPHRCVQPIRADR
jgi:hypothetical protein